MADGSASAAAVAAKEVEYQAGVQKLVDLLSKLNPAAKEFVPSSAAAAGSPPKKGLSADAPVFDYRSIGAGNGGAKDPATDASFYMGNQQRKVTISQRSFCVLDSSSGGLGALGSAPQLRLCVGFLRFFLLSCLVTSGVFLSYFRLGLRYRSVGGSLVRWWLAFFGGRFILFLS